MFFIVRIYKIQLVSNLQYIPQHKQIQIAIPKSYIRVPFGYRTWLFLYPRYLRYRQEFYCNQILFYLIQNSREAHQYNKFSHTPEKREIHSKSSNDIHLNLFKYRNYSH